MAHDVEASLVHRLFYPQVAAVLSAEFRGRISAMPIVSYALVSAKPPIIVVACAQRGHTLGLALKARAFTVSLLDSKHTTKVAKLASSSGSVLEDKLRAVGLRHARAKKVKAPVILGAEATLECSLHSASRVGDHHLLLGRVRACYASGNFSDFWDFSRYKPVLYAGWKDGMSTYPEG